MDSQNTAYITPNRAQAPNGFAKASRILGFLSVGTGIASALMPLFVPFPLMFGMLSIVFGLVSKIQSKQFHSYAITGIVCSGVTLVFLLIAAVFILLFFNTAGGQQLITAYLEQYNELLNAYMEFYGE